MHRLINYSRLHLREAGGGSFFIKDPIYKEINFPQDRFWLYELINTFEFQRLARIKQLAFTCINFPSCNHTRMEHSLGVYELCSRFISQFIANGDLDPVRDMAEINIALASALLHDLGHGPLSHTLELIFPAFNHEDMTLLLIGDSRTRVNSLLRDKARRDGLGENFYVAEVSRVLNGTTPYGWISDLISSDLDVDRLDFLVRDSYYSGLCYGNLDVSLIIKWASLRMDESGNRRFLLSIKAKNWVEHFLLSRNHMYEDLYHNKVSLIYENILREIFINVSRNPDRFRDNLGLKSIGFMLHGDLRDWDIFRFLDLSDEGFLGAIGELLGDGSLSHLRPLFTGFNNTMSAGEYILDRGIKPSYSQREILLNFWDSQLGSMVTHNFVINSYN